MSGPFERERGRAQHHASDERNSIRNVCIEIFIFFYIHFFRLFEYNMSIFNLNALKKSVVCFWFPFGSGYPSVRIFFFEKNRFRSTIYLYPQNKCKMWKNEPKKRIYLDNELVLSVKHAIVPFINRVLKIFIVARPTMNGKQICTTHKAKEREKRLAIRKCWMKYKSSGL